MEGFFIAALKINEDGEAGWSWPLYPLDSSLITCSAHHGIQYTVFSENRRPESEKTGFTYENRDINRGMDREMNRDINREMNREMDRDNNQVENRNNRPYRM